MMEDTISIGVIGLGYVGLPLACAFSKHYDVVGVDIDTQRIRELNEGFDRTKEVDEATLKEALRTRLRVSDTIQEARECNYYIVTVPTPITEENEPDLSPLLHASRAVGSVLKQGDIVIYESTVYPGVTEEECVPVLEEVSSLRFNEDFFVGYSPERINPGDKTNTLETIVKITSGSTPHVAQKVDALYRRIITAGTHLAPSIKVAEAAKVIENTQRDVNIALMNEFAMIFDTMGIDTRAVIEAASTKWNFIRLTPGLVGGHCIGVDPYYLTHKAQRMGYMPNLILGARQINNAMGKMIADKTIKYLIRLGKTVNGAKVLILGATFKENCPDTRNSKVFDIVKELEEFHVETDVYDPWVEPNDSNRQKARFIDTLPLGERRYDAVIVAVGHEIFTSYDKALYEGLIRGEYIVIDVKGVVKEPTWRL